VTLCSRGSDTLIRGAVNTNAGVDITGHQGAIRKFHLLIPSDGMANFDLPDRGAARSSGDELQRAGRAVMAFGLAEVVTVHQMAGRIPVATAA
jgi:hypothetical protein